MNNHMGEEGHMVYTKEAFYDLLQEALPQDRHRMTTSVGPHRDDLRFFSDAIDLKSLDPKGNSGRLCFH